MNLRKLTRKYMVNACPRKDESDFFSVHYNVCRKCEHHSGTEGDFGDTPLWNLLDERIRSAVGSFVLCAHRDGSDMQPTEKQRDFVRVLARDDLRPEGGLKLPSGWDGDLDFCREFIEAHPPCHKCRNGVRLTLRRNRKNKTLFWGCMEYPYCREYKLYVYRAVLEELLALHDKDQNCDADPRRDR